MDLTPYITSLREDLSATAAAGDEQTRRTAAMLSAALEPAVRLALMNALADLAAEVTAGLPEHVVDVRLDGRDVRVVVTGDTHSRGTSTGEQAADAADQNATGGSGRTREEHHPERHRSPLDAGDISRMTLRLVEQVKGQAEQAAAAQGMSLNSFISQAVQGALHGRTGHSAPESGESQRQRRDESHLHGWVRG